MKKELSKKGDFGRKVRSFLRHARLFTEALCIAIAMASLWRGLRNAGYHFCKEDEVILTGGTIAGLVLAYGIIAGLVFNSVYEKYKKVMACVLPQDKRTFLLYRDERLPVIIHLFLASLSILLVGIIMMLDYQEELSGVVAVFSVSFFVCLYWVVVVQLEDAANSPWLAERVPKEWLEEDIDQFFKLENGE